MRQGIIYKATAPNGKAYIGQTITSLARRRADHIREKKCPALARAIIKYGDQIQWAILCRIDREGLDAAEQFYIARYNTISPNGYNLQTGGRLSHTIADESRAKMSAARLGKPPANKGKPRSAITRARISASNRGKKRSAETCAKISVVNKGRKRTEQFKRKLSIANTGKKLTPSHKAKIGAANKGKKRTAQERRKMGRASSLGRYRRKLIKVLTNIIGCRQC